MTAVALDQTGPFTELGCSGLQVGLEGEEGGVGVDLGEDEGDGGGIVGLDWCHDRGVMFQREVIDDVD